MLQLTLTLLLYQPFNPRVPVEDGTITGGVRSTLIVTEAELERPAPLVAEQLNVTPVVSVV